MLPILSDPSLKVHEATWISRSNSTYLFQDDGSVPEDGVGVELDEQIRGADAEQLGRGDGVRRLCGRW